MYRWEEFGRVIVDDGKRNGYEGFSEHDQTSGRSRPGEATFTFIIEKQKKNNRCCVTHELSIRCVYTW